MTWITEPLEFAFFRHGLMVATMAGALCGLIGVYVTLRGMSYIGHGLSHAIFGGAAATVTPATIHTSVTDTPRTLPKMAASMLLRTWP